MLHIQPNHKKTPCHSIILKTDVTDFADVMCLSQTQACGKCAHNEKTFIQITCDFTEIILNYYS